MPYESPSAGARLLRARWLELEAHQFRWIASFGTDILASDDLVSLVERVERLLAADATLDRANLAFAFVDGQKFEPGIARPPGRGISTSWRRWPGATRRAGRAGARRARRPGRRREGLRDARDEALARLPARDAGSRGGRDAQ